MSRILPLQRNTNRYLFTQASGLHVGTDVDDNSWTRRKYISWLNIKYLKDFRPQLPAREAYIDLSNLILKRWFVHIRQHEYVALGAGVRQEAEERDFLS